MADQEKMVKVDLRRSVGQRAAGAGGAITTYGPGQGVEVPESLARSLGLRSVEQEQAATRALGGTATGTRTETGGEQEPQGEQEPDAGQDKDPYEGFLKDDFVAEAERRNLEVKRTDGKDGEPRVEDYRAALEKDDQAKAQG